jgi:hypothetical protein
MKEASVLVEHAFVTTLDENVAMDRAAVFLRRVGLRNLTSEPSRKHGDARRAYRGVPGDFIPRKVQLEFDRGRMSAAIAIEPKGKPQPVHSDLLLALVTGLEQMVAAGQTEDQAAQAWQAIIDQERRRLRRRHLIDAAILFSIIAGFAALIALACNS